MLLKGKRMFWHDVGVPFVRVRHVCVLIPHSRRWFIFNTLENDHHHSLQCKKKNRVVEIQIFLTLFNYFVLRLVEGTNVEILSSSFSLSCTYLAYKCKKKPLHCIALETLSLFLSLDVCVYGKVNGVFVWCLCDPVLLHKPCHIWCSGSPLQQRRFRSLLCQQSGTLSQSQVRFLICHSSHFHHFIFVLQSNSITKDIDNIYIAFFVVLWWGYHLEDEISSGIGCLLVSSQSVALIYV